MTSGSGRTSASTTTTKKGKTAKSRAKALYAQPVTASSESSLKTCTTHTTVDSCAVDSDTVYSGARMEAGCRLNVENHSQNIQSNHAAPNNDEKENDKEEHRGRYDAEAVIRSLRGQLAEALSVIANHEHTICDLREECRSLRATTEEISSEHDELINDMNDALAENDDLTFRLKRTNFSLEQLRIENAHLREEKDNLDEKLEAYRFDSDRLKRRMTMVQHEGLALKNDVKLLRQERDLVQGMVDVVVKEKHEISKDREHLRKFARRLSLDNAYLSTGTSDVALFGAEGGCRAGIDGVEGEKSQEESLEVSGAASAAARAPSPVRTPGEKMEHFGWKEPPYPLPQHVPAPLSPKLQDQQQKHGPQTQPQMERLDLEAQQVDPGMEEVDLGEESFEGLDISEARFLSATSRFDGTGAERALAKDRSNRSLGGCTRGDSTVTSVSSVSSRQRGVEGSNKNAKDEMVDSQCIPSLSGEHQELQMVEGVASFPPPPSARLGHAEKVFTSFLFAVCDEW